MSLTILYLHSCRRDRLRDAFDHALQLLGPSNIAALTEALVQAYQPARSARTNYNYAMHALHRVAGLSGLVAIAIIKEAWNVNSLAPLDDTHPQPTADITHPSTNTPQ